MNLDLGDGRILCYSDIEAAYSGTTPLDKCKLLFPRHRTVPMGFSWSSYLAQSVMVDCVSTIASKDQLLTEEHVTLDPFAPLFSVATDDVFCFERFIERDAGVSGVARGAEYAWA